MSRGARPNCEHCGVKLTMRAAIICEPCYRIHHADDIDRERARRAQGAKVMNAESLINMRVKTAGTEVAGTVTEDEGGRWVGVQWDDGDFTWSQRDLLIAQAHAFL